MCFFPPKFPHYLIRWAFKIKDKEEKKKLLTLLMYTFASAAHYWQKSREGRICQFLRFWIEFEWPFLIIFNRGTIRLIVKATHTIPDIPNGLPKILPKTLLGIPVKHVHVRTCLCSNLRFMVKLESKRTVRTSPIRTYWPAREKKVEKKKKKRTSLWWW